MPQGVIISLLWGISKHVFCLAAGMVLICVMRSLPEMVIHIGVGSDVVCSIELGNARASVRGTDNRRFHAFFVSIGEWGEYSNFE